MLVRVIGVALGWLSLLVPEAGERALWQARWTGSLNAYTRWLETRRLSPAEFRRHLLTYFRDGAVEALSARFPGSTLPDAVHRRLRSPWAALIVPLTVLLAGILVSGQLAPVRRAFRPLVPSAGTRLVTAEPGKSYFGKTPGFTARQFSIVRDRSRSYEIVAGFSTRRSAVEAGGGIRTIAFATPELFRLLALPPDAQALVAEELDASRWLGRTIEVAGRRYRVDGVWPKHFRPALARPDFWIVESEAVFAERRYDTTLAARLRPGVTPAAATAELADIMLSAPPRRGTGTPDTIVPLGHRQAGAYGALAIAWLVLSGALTGAAVFRGLRDRSQWRKELFFAAKALPLISGIGAIAVAALDLRWAASAAGAFFVFWWAGIFAALAIWLAWRDQSTRCPECLTRMSMAVQIGTHGNPLLEGVGDELICEYGHGALWLPGAPAQAFGPEVWRGQ